MFVVLLRILAFLPLILRLGLEGRLTVPQTGWLLVLFVFCLVTRVRLVGALISGLALVLFLIEYSDGTAGGITAAASSLMVVAIAVWGIYIMLSGLRGSSRGR